MSWVHRFLVVPDAHVALARQLAQGIAPPPSADGLWTVGLNATGTGTPTHWISSGLIYPEFAAMLGDAQATYDAAGGAVPLAAIEALYAASVIRDDAEGREMEILAEMGLKMLGGEP